MYSSANNSAKGHTEVEPAPVIPALDRWQPMHAMIRSKGRSHNSRFEFACINSPPFTQGIEITECWNIDSVPLNPSFHYSIIPAFLSVGWLSVSSCKVILRPLVLGPGENISCRAVL